MAMYERASRRARVIATSSASPKAPMNVPTVFVATSAMLALRTGEKS